MPTVFQTARHMPTEDGESGQKQSVKALPTEDMFADTFSVGIPQAMPTPFLSVYTLPLPTFALLAATSYADT